MDINFSDPVLWMCIGVLLICLLFLVWAIGKLKSPSVPRAAEDAMPFEMPSPISESSDVPPFEINQIEPKRNEKISFETTVEPSRASVTPAANTALNKEMADRLESMSQRLADMQSVLTKQASVPAAAGAPAGAIGQGFSPETIDKLLKIISGVVQQVEVLQKSLNIASPGGQAAIPAGAPPPMGILSANNPKPGLKP